jgi:hypothetical protein
MKNAFKIIAAGFVITLAAACSSSQKHEAVAPQTPAQQAAAQMNAERTNYVNQSQTRIDQLTKYSQDLRTRSASAQKPNDKKMQNAADDLDSLLNDARKSLNEVKTAAPDSWTAYKRDVEKSMDRAESEYSNSMSMIR